MFPNCDGWVIGERGAEAEHFLCFLIWSLLEVLFGAVKFRIVFVVGAWQLIEWSIRMAANWSICWWWC